MPPWPTGASFLGRSHLLTLLPQAEILTFSALLNAGAILLGRAHRAGCAAASNAQPVPPFTDLMPPWSIQEPPYLEEVTGLAALQQAMQQHEEDMEARASQAAAVQEGSASEGGDDWTEL